MVRNLTHSAADDALILEEPGAAVSMASLGPGSQPARLRAVGMTGEEAMSSLASITNHFNASGSAFVTSASIAAPNVALLAMAVASVADALRTAVRDAALLSALPGEVRAFAGNLSDGLPEGWVPADGRCFPVYALPELFSAIGVTWLPEGSHAGCPPDTRHVSQCFAKTETESDTQMGGTQHGLRQGGTPARRLLPQNSPEQTFCVPDLRGRTIKGAAGDLKNADAPLDTCIRTLLNSSAQVPKLKGLNASQTGTSTGNETVTLTVSNLPSHSHILDMPAYLTPDQDAQDQFVCQVKDNSDCGCKVCKQKFSVKEAQVLQGQTTGKGQPASVEDPSAWMTWMIFTGRAEPASLADGEPAA